MPRADGSKWKVPPKAFAASQRDWTSAGIPVTKVVNGVTVPVLAGGVRPLED